MNRQQSIRKEAISRSRDWWYCDNIVCHEGELGLLHMGFPRAFILIRDEMDIPFCSFEEFKNHLAEVNFFTPSEREECDIDNLLTDAWNFMALQEEREEELDIDRRIDEHFEID